jgi:hypothetical protein
MNSLPQHKFKSGDRVVQKSSGYEGTVRSASVYNTNGQPIYYIDFDHGWMGLDVIAETELDVAPSKAYVATESKPAKTRCECGAHATSFPDSHSLWCPLHRVD